MPNSSTGRVYAAPVLRRLAGGLALPSLLLVSLLALQAEASARAAPQPGSAGLGERLFPLLGNGGYEVGSYRLELRYPTSRPAQRVSGRVTLVARARRALSSFHLDFAGDSVGAVRVNGTRARRRRFGPELVITPRDPLRARRRFVARVDFTSHVTPTVADETFPRGWFTTLDGSVTAAQPDTGHTIFPANDHPSDKASYTFRLDVPKGVTAVANGVLTGRRSRRGRTLWSYRQRQPMASQLVQLAVGELDVVERGRARGTSLRDVVARSVAAEVEPALAGTPRHLGWLVDRVGRYPFDVYGVLVVEQPLSFALETQTLSLTSAEQFDPAVVPPSLAEIILVHELAHQWFGDSVAVETWSDLWLSEGHATWYEQTYSDERLGTDFVAFIRSAYANGDAWRAAFGPVARPRFSNLALFSPNVYDGGALVLYALRQRIGARAFRKVERGWAQGFAGRSAGTDDFIAHASKASGRNLRGFLRAWLYGSKTPPMPGHPDWTVNPASAQAQARAAGRASAGSVRGLEHGQAFHKR